jgi:DNA-binding response OmpR family regulator
MGSWSTLFHLSVAARPTTTASRRHGRLRAEEWRSDNNGVMSDQIKILVADDAATVRLLLTRALEAAGYDVTAVEDGVAACQTGIDGDFDLALLDHLMPGMLGTEILQQWTVANVGFPTIVLSGVDDDDLVIQLLELGAVDFVRKPFNVKELLIRVRIHLSVPATEG